MMSQVRAIDATVPAGFREAVEDICSLARCSRVAKEASPLCDTYFPLEQIRRDLLDSKWATRTIHGVGNNYGGCHSPGWSIVSDLNEAIKVYWHLGNSNDEEILVWEHPLSEKARENLRELKKQYTRDAISIISR